MIEAFVILILVIATNYSMLGFICHGLYAYGAWLNENHKVDLWLLRVLVSMNTCILKGFTVLKRKLKKLKKNILYLA